MAGGNDTIRSSAKRLNADRRTAAFPQAAAFAARIGWRSVLRAGFLTIVLGGCLLHGQESIAAPPASTLDTIFPLGGQTGTTVDVTFTGQNLAGLRSFDCTAPGVRCELAEPTKVRLTIPPETPPGLYDLRGIGDGGISAARTFFIGNRPEFTEAEPNESSAAAAPVPLNSVINGRIDKGGDVDHFRFEARQGERVVIECWAERIQSQLRPTLEVFDAKGRRLAVNRGYFDTDPLIDLHIPADGAYVVRVQDLVLSASAEHFYRLDIDTGPRVAFAVPAVVERDKPSRVKLFGWNLSAKNRPTRSGYDSTLLERSSNPALPALVGSADASGFDQIEVEISAEQTQAGGLERIRRSAAQAVIEGCAYQLPGSHFPVALGVTDVSVVTDEVDNHSAERAQGLTCPGEVSGQLATGDERDWYAIQGTRGEVLYFEVLADRIGSPIDAQLTVYSGADRKTLATFGDEVRNPGGIALTTSHLDPSGRWVVPSDGRYLLEVRNLTGGSQTDTRRTYRLSVRREDPAFTVVATPRRNNGTAINLLRGGREALDVVVLRRRGEQGAIRISARDLPGGLECPDVWLGPNVDLATMIVSADRNVEALHGELKLEAFAERGEGHPVQWAAPVRNASLTGVNRLVSRMPLAVAGEAPLRIVADANEPLTHQLYGKLPPRHSPGGILDVAIRVERANASHQAPIKLIGIGLPAALRNATAIMPLGVQEGHISFYLPPTLPVGKYSLAIAAETTVPTPDYKTEAVTVFSNLVILDVKPDAFTIEIDPFAPTKARRGETIQVRYSVQRKNGFIGKVHTELADSGHITDVPGLRCRGETFVGQTDHGSLQILVNDDAPLGRHPFLKLLAVGVVEDEPTYQGADFFPLEIVE